MSIVYSLIQWLSETNKPYLVNFAWIARFICSAHKWITFSPHTTFRISTVTDEGVNNKYFIKATTKKNTMPDIMQSIFFSRSEENFFHCWCCYLLLHVVKVHYVVSWWCVCVSGECVCQCCHTHKCFTRQCRWLQPNVHLNFRFLSRALGFFPGNSYILAIVEFIAFCTFSVGKFSVHTDI